MLALDPAFMSGSPSAIFSGHSLARAAAKRQLSFGCGSKLNHLGPQVLFHVATYQVFQEPRLCIG